MADGPVCRVCGSALLAAQAVYCARCGTPHHRDCWDYGGRCSTYGCGSLEFRPEPPALPSPVVISERELLSQERSARALAFRAFLAGYPRVAAALVSARADSSLDGFFGWISGSPGHDVPRLLRSLRDGLVACVGAVIVAGTVPVWFAGYLVARLVRLVLPGQSVSP